MKLLERLWRWLSTPWLRFPLSVILAIALFSVASADTGIPPWAKLLTQTYDKCWPFCNTGPTPSPSTQYHYASIDASAGGGTCPDPENPDYVSAVKALMNTGQTINVFWFLRSLEWAQNTSTCGGNNPPTDAASWGAWQAGQLVNAINDPQLDVNGNPPAPYWSAVFADVEVYTLDYPADYPASQCPGGTPCAGTPCSQSTDPTQCAGPLNAGYWYFDAAHQAENVQVIEGFMKQLCGVDQFCYDGFYSSYYAWPEITGGNGYGAPPSAIDNALLVWLGSMQAGPATLNTQQQRFTTQGYYLYSWQYATNDSGISTDCEVSGPTYAEAQDEASNASPWIGRFDVWTNGSPDKVC